MGLNRTTITLEPDVAEAVQRLMREKQISLKRVVNDAIRAGLPTLRKPKKRSKFTVEPHDFGFPTGTDLDRLHHLADEVEDSQVIRKLLG